MAGALVVFAFVSQLSKASVSGLDSAVLAEQGRAGTYIISLSERDGIPDARLDTLVSDAADGVDAVSLFEFEVFSGVELSCAPDGTLGEQTVVVGQTRRGLAPTFVGGSLGQPVCVGGMTIPDDAVKSTTDVEARQYGGGVVLDTAYRDVVSAAAKYGQSHHWLVITDSSADVSETLRESLVAGIDADAVRSGVVPRAVYMVERSDDATEVREATEGTKQVYGFISWAVLILGGVGVATVQTIAIRHRTWFYALCSAVGARSRRLAMLIAVESGAIFVVSTLATLGILLALSSPVQGFGREAFGTSIDLVEPGLVGALCVASLIALTVATVPPAVIATRQDPLAVLEAPTQ